jgi:hypothetical protein
MASSQTRARFDGHIRMLGFGSIGQAVLPLLLRHIDMRADQIEIIKPSEDGLAAAREFGVPHTAIKVDCHNYKTVLESRLQPGDFLLNVSVDVSSKALIELCLEPVLVPRHVDRAMAGHLHRPIGASRATHQLPAPRRGAGPSTIGQPQAADDTDDAGGRTPAWCPSC